MKKGRRYIGIILIVVSLISMVCWEKWGRNNLLYDEVLMIKSDLEKNQIVTEDMLTTMKIDKALMGSLKPRDYKSIIGKETIQFVKGGTQIFDRYFSDPKLVVNGQDNQFIMAIPNSWLESYPQTLRRGDRAYFYSEGKAVTSAIVAYAKDGTNQEVISKDDKRLAASATVSLIEVVVDNNQSAQLTDLASKGKKYVILYN